MNSFFPSLAEIVIEKGNSLFLCQVFTELGNQVTLLVFAVEQGRSECLKLALFGHLGGVAQTIMIAVSASFLLPECHVSQEVFHRVVIDGDKPQIDVFRVVFEGFEAPLILGVGVNIGVVKQSKDLVPLVSEYFQGIDGAGCAAYMKEDFHN
jgi:hypothetical protein